MRNPKVSEAKRNRAIRAYETYLCSLRSSHENSFIRNDPETEISNQDIQLSMHFEIEIVEDIINVLKRKHYHLKPNGKDKGTC
jgi:hypothetical protein